VYPQPSRGAGHICNHTHGLVILADESLVAAPTTSQASVPKANARFVARQPILTSEEKVFGYELLFRNGVDEGFGGANRETASRSTVQTSMLVGLDVLCDGHKAFVNCSREVLLKEYITLLPSTQAVVEVLESVPADDLVIAACRRLKDAGYLIALDDFEPIDIREPLIDVADIIKVDIRQTQLDQAAAMVVRYAPSRIRMLAEKVETREEFLAAKQAGFVYFQGYFFRKPELLTTHEIPENRANYLRMWQAASRPQLDVREIENLIKGEASLCYRLLRYLNSPAFGLANEIQSVRHALTMLGEREVRRWIRLVATLGAGQGKPTELVLSALTRGRFCELFSSKIRHQGSDLFLLGLLSLMDAILQIPMDQVLENVPVDRGIRAALQGKRSSLTTFYQLMVAQESADWQTVTELAKQLSIPESSVAENYWTAVRWAQQVTAEG
jgi:c-di-GMP-related signal transduction protein